MLPALLLEIIDCFLIRYAQTEIALFDFFLCERLWTGGRELYVSELKT